MFNVTKIVFLHYTGAAFELQLVVLNISACLNARGYCPVIGCLYNCPNEQVDWCTFML